VQLVARYARNHELRIKVNHSCIKMHATYEIVNYTLRLIIRASICTLRMKSWITASRLIIHASRCTLHMKSWITHQG